MSLTQYWYLIRLTSDTTWNEWLSRWNWNFKYWLFYFFRIRRNVPTIFYHPCEWEREIPLKGTFFLFCFLSRGRILFNMIICLSFSFLKSRFLTGLVFLLSHSNNQVRYVMDFFFVLVRLDHDVLHLHISHEVFLSISFSFFRIQFIQSSSMLSIFLSDLRSSFLSSLQRFD